MAPAALAVPTPSGQFAISPPAAAAVEGEFLVEATPDEAAAAGLTVVGEAGFGWTLVRQSPSRAASVEEDAAQLAATTAFDVEPNYIYELAQEPRFPDQWSLENTGQTGGTVDADIDILTAWTVTTGSAGVTIAVLDTGVAFSHPDMASSVWTNTGEQAGNNVDDDGNGYIDDVRGWDMVDGDADPSDAHGHGTFVSTIAAAPLNGVGMAGVAPKSMVMPVRVCGDSNCPGSAILAGITYAMENNADVINLSLGGYGASSAMENAIREATAAGIVVVAAAGNDSVDNDVFPFYPASYDVSGLISVAASNHNDSLAWFSNYGATSVDLVAPGQSVVGGRLPNTWGTGSGTSFAAPKVAGVVALIMANKPSLNAVQVANLITGSVDVLSNLSNTVASSGRLNAGKAVVPPQQQANASDEQFFYRASDGLFLYYDVSSSGALTKLLRSGKYSPGWSSIMAIDLDGDGRDEQFFYRASDGLFLYYDVSSSGALTKLLRSGKYSPGWSSIMAINLDN